MPNIHIIENKTLSEKVKKRKPDSFNYRSCKKDNPVVNMGV